jgi:hypothetical protein
MCYQQFASHAFCGAARPVFKTEHTGSLFLLRRHLGNWPRGLAVSIRSELPVAHKKLGQLLLLLLLLLLTVYILPVQDEKWISCQLLKPHHPFVNTLYI